MLVSDLFKWFSVSTTGDVLFFAHIILFHHTYKCLSQICCGSNLCVLCLGYGMVYLLLPCPVAVHRSVGIIVYDVRFASACRSSPNCSILL